MDKDYGFGGWGIVILIALFFLLFAGRGFGGSGESSPATQADVQRATDFAALERQNNEGVAATRQSAYDVTSAVKDNAYNILGELRDLQSVTESGISVQQKCCCDILRAIDGVNYNASINACEIKTAIHAEGEATRTLLQQQENQRLRDELAQSRREQRLYAVAVHPRPAGQVLPEPALQSVRLRRLTRTHPDIAIRGIMPLHISPNGRSNENGL